MVNPADYLRGEDLEMYNTLTRSQRHWKRSMVCISCLDKFHPRPSGMCEECERMDAAWNGRTFTPWRSIAAAVRLWIVTVARERKEYETSYYALKERAEAGGVEIPPFYRVAR